MANIGEQGWVWITVTIVVGLVYIVKAICKTHVVLKHGYPPTGKEESED